VLFAFVVGFQRYYFVKTPEFIGRATSATSPATR
jgi:hypothetical protein